MIHFAYPTAKGNEFLACGRFIASAERLSGYEVAAPNIANRSEINVAVSELAPESDESPNLIYEKKDESPQKFMGDSMDLAYLLALISLSRSLKIPEEINGDIWCTGTIDIKNNKYPFLKRVNPIGFDGKLKGFVSDNNPDRLFIVPASNIENHHQALLQEHNVNVVTLNGSNRIDIRKLCRNKTVLKIRENDLAVLRDFLFQKHLNKKLFLKTACFILIAVLLVAGIWRHFINSSSDELADTIFACLENGEFNKAIYLINKSPLNNTKNSILKATVDKPIIVEIKLQYQIAGKHPYTSDLYSLDSQELKQLSLTHNDNYRFQIMSYLKDVYLYLYVFQIDSFGKLDILFPPPSWMENNTVYKKRGESYNPVHFSNYICNIPPDEDEWLYLNEIYEVNNNIEETLYIIASPWKAVDLENLYKNYKNSNNENQNQQLSTFISQLKQRQHSGVSSVFYKEFSFRHKTGKKPTDY